LFILNHSFEPETLESRSKAQKTRTRVLFPMKTSAKQLGLRPGNMSQNDPKATSLTMSVTNNPHPPTNKFFSSAIY